MHLFLPAADMAPFLVDELARSGASAPSVLPAADYAPLVQADSLPEHSLLAFAWQTLPNAISVTGASINGWADQIIGRIAGVVSDAGPWRLHLWPVYGEGRAGWHRCELIRAALMERLKKKRRALLKGFEEGSTAWTSQTSLVQAMLTGPDEGFLSVAVAPQPFDRRALISTFPGGVIAHAEDKAAPSRAFAKVIEAELRLGRHIQKGQACVDLGASPGSWSYVAIQRGAYVTAIDRSPLREDLMRNPRLTFQQADAFKFRPPQPVDWLICDIIAAPQRSIDLLLEWLREGQMSQFIVTIKFKGTEEYALLDQLKEQAAPLCSDFRLMRLCANKNEVTAFGVV